MAAKAGLGIDIDVANVPLRNPDLEPFEVMISESQERMLAVVEPGNLNELRDTCERWQTGAAVVGEVTGSGHLRVLHDGEEMGDIPVSILVDACPAYDLAAQAPEGWQYGNETTLDPGAEADRVLLSLLASPNIASKRWAFEQYDSIVGSRTLRRPEWADAAVLTVPEAGGAIAVAIDGNGRRVACDPRLGTIEAVLECGSNLACVGAEPLGVTNCLNFGNPEKPEVAWQLQQAVAGLAEACEALGVPVVGGNVSLYNEAPEGPIYPTPVVGMAGEVPDADRTGGIRFANDGDAVAIVGPFAPSLAGSELAKLRGELDLGLPRLDLGGARAAIEAVRDAVRAGSIASAHDVSDGGIAPAIAECAIAGGIGAAIDLDPLIELRGCSSETAAFGEGPAGFILAGDREALEAIGTEVLLIGEVGGDRLELSAAELEISVPVSDAESAWRSLPTRLEG